jgi:hypothetical protein
MTGQEFELLFKVTSVGVPDLTGELKRLTDQGLTAGEALEQVAASAKKVGIDGARGAEQITTAFRGTIGGFTESRMSAMLLGEELGLHLPRAITQAIARTEALGSALKALLPIGIAAFAGLELGRFIVKIVDLKDEIWNLKSANEAFGKTSSGIWDELRRNIELTHAATARYLTLTQGAAAGERYKMRVAGEDITIRPKPPDASKMNGMSKEAKDSIYNSFTEIDGLNALGSRLTSVQARGQALADAEKNYGKFASSRRDTPLMSIYGVPIGATTTKYFNGVDMTRSLKDIHLEREFMGSLATKLQSDVTLYDANQNADRAQLNKDLEKAGGPQRHENELLNEYRDRIKLEDYKGPYRPLGEAVIGRDRRLRQIQENTGLSASEKRSDTAIANKLGWMDISNAQNDLRGYQSGFNLKMGEEQDRLAESVANARIKGGVGPSSPLYDAIYGNDFDVTGAVPMSARQYGQMSLASARGGARLTSAMGTGGADDGARGELQIRLQEIDLEKQMAISEANRLDSAQQLGAVQAANFEAQKASFEATIDYQTKIAEIGKRQQEEAGGFISGLVSASLSGKPSASTNYLRGFGQDIFSHIVSNTAGAMTGPGGLNNMFSLGKTGLLANADGTPSFMGKMLKGTPFDFSSKELNAPLIDSNTRLKEAVDANTRALGGTPPSGGSGGGSGSGGGGGLTGGLSTAAGGIGGAISAARSGGVGGFLKSLGGFFGGHGGYGGGGNAGGGGIPAALFSGTPLGGDGASPYSGAGSTPLTAALAAATGLPHDMADKAIQAMSAGPVHDAAATAGGVGKLGGALGAFGHLDPDKYAFAKNHPELAKGLGMAGTGLGVAAGAYESFKGFQKGGARGDIQGIGAGLMAAGMIPSPASPFLEAGGALLGLVSSLFPDPRQQRILQEQKNLTNDQFLRPAARDYNFGGGGGGFSLGMGSTLQQGGPTANYNVTMGVHAMDAKNFVQWMRDNPSAAGETLLAGLTDGGQSAVSSQIAFNSQYGSGYVPPGGLSAGG